jgi:hypothetical protein
MSGKQEKKIRQLYKRDFSHRMNEAIGDVYEQIKKIHKPAPRYFPTKLWVRLGRIFLNI